MVDLKRHVSIFISSKTEQSRLLESYANKLKPVSLFRSNINTRSSSNHPSDGFRNKSIESSEPIIRFLAQIRKQG